MRATWKIYVFHQFKRNLYVLYTSCADWGFVSKNVLFPKMKPVIARWQQESCVVNRWQQEVQAFVGASDVPFHSAAPN